MNGSAPTLPVASPKAIRVVFTVGSLASSAGGPSIAVAGTAGALGEAGADLTIATQFSPGGAEVALPSRIPISRHPLGVPRAYGPSASLNREIAIACRTADVVHSFGLWRAVNRYSAVAARLARRPHVISPTGMLEPQALRRRAEIKRVFWVAWQRGALERAALIHATGPIERESIRRAGIAKTPVTVIPHGITCPILESLLKRKAIDAAWPALAGQRYLLYLGRLHPFKGISNLLGAFSRLGHDCRGVRLVLAGPDCRGYSVEVRAQAETLGLNEAVVMTGEVEGERKWGLLRNAEVLVLPSRSENFGLTVAEALAVETPAIANRNAPWQALEHERCGWWVQPGEEDLAEALAEALSLSASARGAMGERGRRYVERELSWSRIASMFLAAYSWVGGYGPRPEWVECPS